MEALEVLPFILQALITLITVAGALMLIGAAVAIIPASIVLFVYRGLTRRAFKPATTFLSLHLFGKGLSSRKVAWPN